MATTKRKGDLGEAMVMADALERGYQVAIPLGEDWRYDLIVLRNGVLTRVQCKFVQSDGSIIKVPCRSSNAKCQIKYTSDDTDWIAVYDATTKKVYYIPSSYFENGRSSIWLRLAETKNGQKANILMASDFLSW